MKKVTYYVIENEDLAACIIFLKKVAFEYVEAMMEDHNINGIYELFGICNSLIKEIEKIGNIQDLISKIKNGDFSQIGIETLNDFCEDFESM